jgi:D-xylose 1-dehydrogenase (NADP+, D-xylono-1,5-lactone-forming)
MRVGVLSTAWIASLVVPLTQGSKTVEFVAVASRRQERAREFASMVGIGQAYGTYEELLQADDIDCIYIALPNALHREWVQAALEAGKHVLCEKPLTPSASEAELLFALAEERGLLLAEGFMYRHHPQTAKAIEVITRGDIGEPRSIDSWFHTKAANPETNIRYSIELAGGALYDVGSYCVSFSNLVARAEPHHVAGTARAATSGVDEGFTGLLLYEDGLAATFDCGMDSTLSTGVRVVGTEATLTIANPWLPDIDAPIWGGPMPASEVVVSRGTEATRFSCTADNPYRLQFENAAAALAGDSILEVSREDTLSTLRTIERLQAAAGDRKDESMSSVGR